MNRSKTFLFIGVVLVILSSYGCSKDSDKCLSYSTESVIKVEGAITGAVNEELNLHVTYTSGLCDTFFEFDESVDIKTSTIKVITSSETCICTLQLVPHEAIYKFKATEAGTYTLKFQQEEGLYITHTVIAY